MRDWPRLVALAGPLLLCGCQEKQAEAPPVRPVLSILIGPVADRTFGFTGTVEPRYKVDLGFRVLGRMVSRTVYVGDPVKAGERIAAIDPIALENAVRLATADVLSARAQLTNASGIEGRQRILAERNVSSQAQLEGAQQGRDTATAALSRAEANLAKAKEQLGYAQLRSDADGVVTVVGAQVGQVVSAGQTVVTVARPGIREAAIDVPDDIARALEPGAAFDVALQLDPGLRTPGRAREIAPQADPSTRTRRVRISLPEATDLFRLGTTVNAVLRVPPPPGFELPGTALLERDGKSFVWVVDAASKTVSTREIKVGAREGDRLRVAEGLRQGDRIVTAGVDILQQGQRVTVPDEATR